MMIYYISEHNPLPKRIIKQPNVNLTVPLYLPIAAIIAATIMVLSVTFSWSHDTHANPSAPNRSPMTYHQILNDLAEFNPTAITTVGKDSGNGIASAADATPTSLLAAKKHINSVQVAIIIDDIGYNYAQGVKAMQLPGAITYAIIPHSPKATFFARHAQQLHKEVMLHVPMSTVYNTPLGKDGLTESMGEHTFKQALTNSLALLPNAKGVNNHMGSLLTQKDQPMNWMMQSLKQKQLYFIDSRTSTQSVAWAVAQEYGIPSLKRDIFLDHEVTEKFIASQFKKFIAKALLQGYAVAIAHPYPETILYLEQNLASLSSHNITLVSASELANRFSKHQILHEITRVVTHHTKLADQ